VRQASVVPSSGPVKSAFPNNSGLQARDSFFALLGALRV
jgi:hypothetical protein